MKLQIVLTFDASTSSFFMEGNGLENLVAAYGMLGMAMQELITRRIQPPSAIIAPPPGMLVGGN